MRTHYPHDQPLIIKNVDLQGQRDSLKATLNACFACQRPRFSPLRTIGSGPNLLIMGLK